MLTVIHVYSLTLFAHIPHYSTCFYALCLISKTIQGANVLLELGWTSVQHSPEEKWPLNFDQFLDIDESPFDSPSADSPVRRFTFAPFIGTSFDLYSPGTGPGESHSPLSAGSTTAKYETLPGKVAGSKSFAENLHSSPSSTPTFKDLSQSARSSIGLSRGLGKSDSSASLVSMPTNRFRRSISRKGSTRRFYKSVKERSERSSHRHHGLATKHSQSVSQAQSSRQRFSVSGLVSSPEIRAQRYEFILKSLLLNLCFMISLSLSLSLSPLPSPSFFQYRPTLLHCTCIFNTLSNLRAHT